MSEVLTRLDIPKSLHKKVALYAARDGVDIETFVNTAMAEKLGATKGPSKMAKTSKATAKLAADYLNMTRAELVGRAVTDPDAFLRDVRKLAGSVLRQVEVEGEAK